MSRAESLNETTSRRDCTHWIVSVGTVFDSISAAVVIEVLEQVLEMRASPVQACEVGESGRNDMPRDGEPTLGVGSLICQIFGLACAPFDDIEEFNPLLEVPQVVGCRNTEQARRGQRRWKLSRHVKRAREAGR